MKTLSIKKTSAKEKIVTVALQLFFEHGYKGVSYEMLMSKTGLSKGAIYHHFTSKNELLVSTFSFLAASFDENSKINFEDEISDFKSFKKIFIRLKLEQLSNFKKMIKAESLKSNKLLFFVEALNENKKLIHVVNKIMKQEKLFIEKCLSFIKSNPSLLKGKSLSVWAEILFLLLQGAEAKTFFVEGEVTETNFRKYYAKAFDNFENLLH
jgi:AcrR family transcriptional regulator